MEILAEVKGLGIVKESIGDFSANIRELKGRIISPRDEAYARIATQGKENIGLRYGTRTSAGIEYTKGELPIFNLSSKLLNPELAKQAVRANRNGRYFSTETRTEYDESLKQAQENKGALVLPSRQNFQITPTKNSKVLEFALKDQAGAYWDLHKKVCGDVPITFHLVDENTVDSQPGVLLTELWFGGLDDGSYLNGYYGYCLYIDGRARGVFDSGKAGAKISKPKNTQEVRIYTPAQLSKYQKILQSVREGNLPASKLEKVA